MSTIRELHREVKAKLRIAIPVCFGIYDRRQEDRCGCKGQCWLVKNSPSLFSNYSSEQILDVVKCQQLCQIQRGVLEAEAA